MTPATYSKDHRFLSSRPHGGPIFRGSEAFSHAHDGTLADVHTHLADAVEIESPADLVDVFIHEDLHAAFAVSTRSDREAAKAHGWLDRGGSP